MSLIVDGNPADASKTTNVKKRSRIVPLLLVLVGIVLLLYPLVGTYAQNFFQSQQAAVYTKQTENFTQEERDAALASAEAWNEQNAGAPILDPWLNRVREDNFEYHSYLDQLALTEVMSRIIIPSISSDLPIYHGTTEEVLNKGIGHLYGSSLPTGGSHSHTVLTGHTGLPHATLWDNLTQLKKGDAIFIDTLGRKMKYVVTSTEVVLPHETESLTKKTDGELLTLITCTPYGVNSHRLLVHAERVDYTPEDEQVFTSTHMPWQWWMTAIVIAVGIVTLIILAEYVRQRRTKSSTPVNENEQ